VATKIRLARFGRKKRPFYRIVIADSRSPRDGRHLEKIGYYDPLTSPATVNVDKEKAFHWLEKGAVPTITVRNLLSGLGVLLEWELRKAGRPEKDISEELQKFNFLREQKLKSAQTRKKRVSQEKTADAEDKPAAPAGEAEEEPVPAPEVSQETEQTEPAGAAEEPVPESSPESNE